MVAQGDAYSDSLACKVEFFDTVAEDRAMLVDEGVDIEENRNNKEAVEGEVFLVIEELLGFGLVRGRGR